MKLVFATNNLNKLKEVQVLIPEYIQLLSLQDIGCHEDVPETQNTIEGNAIQKAEYIKKKYGFDCFADDTGLEVEALKWGRNQNHVLHVFLLLYSLRRFL